MTWRRRSRCPTASSCSPPRRARGRSASSPSTSRGRATWPRSASPRASWSCMAASGPRCARRCSRPMPSASGSRNAAGRQHRRVPLFVWRVLLLAAAFLAWYALTETGVLPGFFFGRPVVVLQRVWEWFSSGKIYPHLAVTLVETVLAFAIGTLLGVAAGLWLGLTPTAASLLDPYIKA